MIKKDYGIKRVHKLAIEMALGDRPTPNLTPITHFAKKSGRPKELISQDTNVLSFKLRLCYVKHIFDLLRVDPIVYIGNTYYESRI